MTRTEQAELQELGMTPERLAEKQANLAAILHGDAKDVSASLQAGIDSGNTSTLERLITAKPPKKRRSDAGVARKPRTQPSEQAQGVLTREQASKLIELMRTKEDMRLQWETARDRAGEMQDAFVATSKALDEFISALTAK